MVAITMANTLRITLPKYFVEVELPVVRGDEGEEGGDGGTE
jgi:hypothetical protein